VSIGRFRLRGFLGWLFWSIIHIYFLIGTRHRLMVAFEWLWAYFTHTAHHRGQQMAMLRMLAHELHSNYGPTADTGGLMQNHAPTIYAYPSIETLLQGEDRGGAKAALPGAGGQAVTERPGQS